MEQTEKKVGRLGHKITLQLMVLGINPMEINKVGDKEFKSRVALFTDSEDTLYPEDIEIQFVSEDRMNQLNELNKGDIVDVTFIIRGKLKSAPGKMDKIWNRFHGLNWEVVHKAVQNAGTLQAGAAASMPQSNGPAPNNQMTTAPAGFTGHQPQVTPPVGDDLPF